MRKKNLFGWIVSIIAWRFLLSLAVISPINALETEKMLDFMNRITYSIQPKIPTDDGSLSDYSLGFRFTDKISSEIRLNLLEKRLNEKFSGIDDSLNVVQNSEQKWFFFPLQYTVINNEKTNFSAGLGLYHYRQKLDENGYFIMSSLDTPVNAYTNNFSMNLTGPIVEAKFSGTITEKFKITAEAEYVPIAFLNAEQTVDIIPLFASNFSSAFSHKQSGSDAMSFQGTLTLDLFNIVDITGIYNGSAHTFDAVDFDKNYNVFISRKKSYTQNIQIEGSVHIKINSVSLNLGIGGIFNSVYLDSSLTTEGNRLYFVFGGKKTFW